jgi:uncharacterized protein YlbG (UPF0298 family)
MTKSGDTTNCRFQRKKKRTERKANTNDETTKRLNSRGYFKNHKKKKYIYIYIYNNNNNNLLKNCNKRKFKKNVKIADLREIKISKRIKNQTKTTTSKSNFTFLRLLPQHSREDSTKIVWMVHYREESPRTALEEQPDDLRTTLR